MGMHIVMTGNPVDGFEVLGPFATYDEASEWAERNDRKFENSWWILPLRAQEEIGG
jgi:hypothetical protein